MSEEEKKIAQRERLFVFAATWLSYAGFYLCRKVLGVVKAPLKDALSIDDISLAHITTAYLVTYMLGQFLTAWLSRRVKSRTLLLYGMGVTLLCSAFIAAVLPLGRAAYWPILLAMSVHGVAQATGWSANVGIMTQWTSHSERGRIMAIWGTCYQLGSALAKALAAFLLGALGLASAFLGPSILLFLICVFFYVYCREKPEGTEESPAEIQKALEKPASPPKDRQTIIQLIIAMGLIYFSFKFIRYALDSWSSLILKEHFALDPSIAGYVSSIFDWVGFLGVIAAGFLSDKVFLGRRTPMIFFGTVAMFAATLFMLIFGLQTPVLFGISLGLVGFTLMGPDSLLSGAGAMDVGGQKWAVIAASVINGLGSIGPIIQEELIGWLKTTHGPEAVLMLLVGMSGVATLGTGLLLLSVRRRGISL
jgi:OPA family sugar phosphate sensor protein UhpC-like MFS transporter